MHLKKLELSGFKSFAKTTVLEFPSAMTAVVGPNGSGKSNITEAIRWVLGEQSMKSLRGKKGEDLVWNGSAHVPRMGKASVSLFFDNQNKELPIDPVRSQTPEASADAFAHRTSNGIEFDEVILTRKVFRDGVNEYLINDSAVRLKDVVEMIARMGLGEQKHNIISQGEVDHLLLATPRERREMLEEALGLRVWQLKKNEAERKLEATRRNMEQADALIRELAPHLKFLRVQAKRVEAATRTRRELDDLQYVYVVREEREIAAEEAAWLDRRTPLADTLLRLRQEIAGLAAQVEEAEAAAAAPEISLERERSLADASRKRVLLEREIGRLEGKLEAARHRAAVIAGDADAVRQGGATGDMRARMREVLAMMRALVREQDDIEVLRARFFPLMEEAERILAEREYGGTPAASLPVPGPAPEVAPLEHEIREQGAALEQLVAGIGAQEEVSRRESDTLRAAHERLRDAEKALRARRDAEREAVLGLERLQLDEERIAGRTRALNEMRLTGIREARPGDATVVEQWRSTPPEELRRRIERYRARVEEAGGIDPAVVKEYEETEARHAFLIKEREDVAAATASLALLVKELDARIAQDFNEGFAKIKAEFHNYFRIVFGGGSGTLRLLDLTSRSADDETQESEEKEEGIEIAVDVPRKRIRGLAMLSGGERALTAVALLFAITAVNPPPFLILDETDAALDEANSQRYAAILKELAKKTQLILVTHNRETMKSAGVLYGVTMGDDGVSRLLSLKLEEVEGYTHW